MIDFLMDYLFVFVPWIMSTSMSKIIIWTSFFLNIKVILLFFQALEKFGQNTYRVRVVDTVWDLDAEKHKESIRMSPISTTLILKMMLWECGRHITLVKVIQYTKIVSQ